MSIIDNRILADTLNEARDKIIKQGKIAQYLKQTNLFPPIAIYMISTGEESGQLDVMLTTVANNYEEELGEISDKLTASLGPIMTHCYGFNCRIYYCSCCNAYYSDDQECSKYIIRNHT